FQLHGAFSFQLGFWQNPSKGKAPFFLPFLYPYEFHTKDLTLPNVPAHPGNHTYCPNCKKVIIKRTGFFLEEMIVKDGRCTFCRRKIAGVWK
ncbi:MAG: hypothetical protein KBG09_05510, partial [Syntrophobacterales bacterium]|nr:hypothetical protein [Syntrophobacterales bacterium]